MSVAVMRRQDNVPLSNADVHIVAEPVGRLGKRITPVTVPGVGGNRLLSHADLELPSPGRWRGIITVRGSEGKGEVAFEMRVQPQRRRWWLYIGTLGGVGLIWLAWRRVRMSQRPAP